MSDFLKRALLVAALATTQVQADEETTPTPNFPQNTTGTATAVSGPITNTAVSRSAAPSLARGGPVCIETGILFKETFCSSSEVRVVESHAVVEGEGGAALTFTRTPVLDTTICRFGATGGECQISTVPIDLRHLAP